VDTKLISHFFQTIYWLISAWKVAAKKFIVLIAAVNRALNAVHQAELK